MPDSQHHGRAAMIRGLLAPDIAVQAVDVPCGSVDLFPEEWPAVANARPRRQIEFAAGRAAARKAMQQLGLNTHAIPMGDDRAPVWPDNIVGSISHTDDFCVAAIARADAVLAIGIDLESDTPLDRNLWDIVLLPAEIVEILNQPKNQQGGLAKLIFSAKECAYKSQYGLTGKPLEFDAFHVAIAGNGTDFTAEFTADVGTFRAGQGLNGRFARGYGLVATVMTLRPAKNL